MLRNVGLDAETSRDAVSTRRKLLSARLTAGYRQELSENLGGKTTIRSSPRAYFATSQTVARQSNLWLASNRKRVLRRKLRALPEL